MTLEQFIELAGSQIVLLDGATGTHLQSAGMPPGVSPELWVIGHPEVLRDLQRRYLDAGSSILCTSTFGANRVKMARHANPSDIGPINRQLAEISGALRDQYKREHPERQIFVAGDIGPTGRFLYPAGDLTLSEMVDIYREQARGLLAGGVDLFILETMISLAEIRAAMLAIRSECNLPVLSSLTYEANGHTLSGNSPLEGLITLASLGTAAYGINCSFGPDKLGELIEPLRAITPVPLLLKPNAGLPTLVDGRTVFPMQPDEFAAALAPWVKGTVRLAGGCCGTGPSHLAALSAGLSKIPDDCVFTPLGNWICSSRRSVQLSDISELPIVEFTSPDGLVDDVADALEDDPPAIILDFDRVPPAEVWPELAEAIQQLETMSAAPLVFRVPDNRLLGMLLFHYCGRAGYIGEPPADDLGALRLG